MIAWGQDAEEGALSLPCVGIFDDCDDVLKKLEAVKTAYKDDKTITGKIPEFIREKVLIGTHMKLGNEEFDKLNVCFYGEANKEYTINPKEYSEFWTNITPYEKDSAKMIIYGGFEFKFANKHVIRVFAEANALEITSKFDALKKYIFEKDDELDAPKYDFKTMETIREKTVTKVEEVFGINSACNVGVREAIYLITSDPVLFPTTGLECLTTGEGIVKGEVTHPGKAIDIYQDLIDNKLIKFMPIPHIKNSYDENEEIPDFAKIQELANAGYIVIGTRVNDNKIGHIVMAVLGELSAFTTRGQIYYVPMVLDCGEGEKFSKIEASKKWNGPCILVTKWYLYKP
ncbi:MAG: hypothetical protein AB7S50_14825 [Bacteroidales bacterium]